LKHVGVGFMAFAIIVMYRVGQKVSCSIAGCNFDNRSI